MSWLFKSLQSNDPDLSSSSSEGSPANRGGGVKEDLTVISDSIGRQLRGVASFLAPSPPASPSTSSTATTETDKSRQSSDYADLQSQGGLIGIRNDLSEIGGSLRTGLSKFTSNFLQFQISDNQEGIDDDDDDVAGITDEVIDFVKEISLRPECWTDFPLSLPHDFEMSDAQKEHASTVEHFVPSLKALRADLHSYLGDEQFWMIYFILLLPRLSEYDFEALSTPLIVETRNILLQKLQNKRNSMSETSENSFAVETSKESIKVSEKQEENIPSQEKEVTEIVKATERLEIADEKENADQWLKETDTDGENKKVEHEEDVSFSDLEDDDNELSSRLSGSRKAQEITRVPSSSDWVQLNDGSDAQGGSQKARQSISREKDSDGESNEWLKVDDFD